VVKSSFVYFLLIWFFLFIYLYFILFIYFRGVVCWEVEYHKQKMMENFIHHCPQIIPYQLIISKHKYYDIRLTYMKDLSLHYMSSVKLEFSVTIEHLHHRCIFRVT
jgi:hypothetical protein